MILVRIYHHAMCIPAPCPWCLYLCLVFVPVCPCPMSVFRVRSAANPVFFILFFNFFLVLREQKPVRGPIYANRSTMHLCPYPRPQALISHAHARAERRILIAQVDKW